MTYSLNWDLDSIFSGGSDSPALNERLEQLEKQINTYYQSVNQWDHSISTNDELTTLIKQQETITEGFSQCNSYITALLSANVKDTQAKLLSGKLYALLPRWQSADTILSKKFAEISDNNWQTLLQTDEFSLIAFRMNEIRRDGHRLLSEAEENIINTLSLDGLNAWSSHYDTIVGTIVIPFEENGKVTDLSAGQAFNKMMGDPDPLVREKLFIAWEKAWQEKTSLLSDTLNHLDGFRLSTYKLHGMNDYLQKPLEYNRLKKETLDVMWATIQKNKQPLVDYLTRKANLFGKEKMEWQDQDAPIILGDLKEKTFTFDEAASFIIENFQKFSPKMATFAQSAFEKSWIEAEDRPGKRPGGYCTELPETQESSIFMTFSN